MLPLAIRQLIKEKREQKMSLGEIASFLNIPKSTVQYVCKSTYKKEGRVGRPSKLNKSDKVNIKRTINILKQNRERVTSTKILQRNPNLEIKKRTLRDILKKMGGKYKKQPQMPPLSKKSKVKRINVCWDWFLKRKNLEMVVITDECRFSLDGPDNFQTWTFNPEKEHLRIKHPCKGGGVMIWAALLPDGTLHISRIPKSCTKEWYHNLLENEVFPLLNEKFPMGYLFQQDNAPCHTAKVIKQLFQSRETDVLPWPPYSPDLSPIENIFHMLKNLVYDGSQFVTKAALWNRIQEVVEYVNTRKKDTLKDLHNQLAKRGLKIIFYRGFKLKY